MPTYALHLLLLFLPLLLLFFIVFIIYNVVIHVYPFTFVVIYDGMFGFFLVWRERSYFSSIQPVTSLLISVSFFYSFMLEEAKQSKYKKKLRKNNWKRRTGNVELE